MDIVAYRQRCHRTSKAVVFLLKGLLVKDKYPMFEWAPGKPVLYETQEEAPDMINEDEFYFEDVSINDDYNGK